MPFNLLYPDVIDQRRHASHLALYLQGWAEGLGLSKIIVDLDALDRLCLELSHPDFPHVDGIDHASPFKKAAYFFVWCIFHKPVVSALPSELIGPDMAKLANHQNAFFGYQFVTACLHKATLQRKDGKTVSLEKRIRISYHSLCDLIDTFGTVVPSQHFKPACLLFEQMAYKANPKCAYEELY